MLRSFATGAPIVAAQAVHGDGMDAGSAGLETCARAAEIAVFSSGSFEKGHVQEGAIVRYGLRV